MGNNTQSRKWSLVINNPLEAGLDHAAISGNSAPLFSGLFLHGRRDRDNRNISHAYLSCILPRPCASPPSKTGFQRRILRRHTDSARDNRDYIRKEGRWADTDKAETSVPGTFEEWGDLPAEERKSLAGYVQAPSRSPGRYDPHGGRGGQS